MGFDFSDVKVVREISSYSAVNKYIECGWILLNVATNEKTHDHSYSLGWLRDDDPIFPVFNYTLEVT
jgi:hypothetical protein